MVFHPAVHTQQANLKLAVTKQVIGLLKQHKVMYITQNYYRSNSNNMTQIKNVKG